jgi:transposase-like protein
MTAAPEAGTRAAPFADWRRAAKLLAQGEGVAAVAEKLGCSRSQLSRMRNHDSIFQSWIEEFRQLGPDERLARLRETVHRKIEEEVGKGTVRVLLWLADRLNLLTPPSERTPEHELQELLNGLSDEELREFESLGDAEPTADATPSAAVA